MSVKIADVPGYGRALVATGHHSPGKLVLEEKPLFHISSQKIPAVGKCQTTTDGYYAAIEGFTSELVAEVLQDVSAENLEVFRQLISQDGSDLSRLLSTMYETAPDVGLYPSGFGVFYLGAHINHSCVPNVNYLWDEAHKIQKWIAIRDIAEGEQIYLDYLDHEPWTWSILSDRKEKMEHFNFDCACERCKDDASNPEIDMNTAKLAQIQHELCEYLTSIENGSAPNGPASEKAARLSPQYVKLAEQYHGGPSRESIARYQSKRLAFSYKVAARCMSLHGDYGMAKKYMDRVKEIHSICYATADAVEKCQELNFDTNVAIVAQTPTRD